MGFALELKHSGFQSPCEPFVDVFVDRKLGVLGSLVELQQILPLFSEATREEVWEETLNGTENKYVADWRQRNDENDHNGDKRDDILECPPAVTKVVSLLSTFEQYLLI